MENWFSWIFGATGVIGALSGAEIVGTAKDLPTAEKGFADIGCALVVVIFSLTLALKRNIR
jgi:hypothetical protein